MIKIYNSLIPVKGFTMMTVLFFLFIRKEYRDSPQLNIYSINHEHIHSCQQVELLILSIVLNLIIIPIFNISWWWMFSSILIPFILYIITWFVEIILPPYDKAYKNICFETEARYNEQNLNYTKTRKPFAFIKYISNKKYPAK